MTFQISQDQLPLALAAINAVLPPVQLPTVFGVSRVARFSWVYANGTLTVLVPEKEDKVRAALKDALKELI